MARAPPARSPPPASCWRPRSRRPALVPLQAFRELAFLLATGLLIDAFLVRSVLVPAVIALAGYRSGWPGTRLHRVAARAGRAVVAEAAPSRTVVASVGAPRAVVAVRESA